VLGARYHRFIQQIRTKNVEVLRSQDQPDVQPNIAQKEPFFRPNRGIATQEQFHDLILRREGFIREVNPIFNDCEEPTILPCLKKLEDSIAQNEAQNDADKEDQR